MISEKRQSRLIIFTSIIGILGSLSTGILYSSLYFQMHSWQLLPISIAAIVSFFVWLLVLWLVKKSRLEPAGLISVCNLVLVLATYVAVVSQPFLESLLAGGALLLIGGIFIINKKWWLAIIVTAVYAAFTLYVNQSPPFSLFNISLVTSFGNYFYILSGIIIFIVLVEIIFSSSFFTNSIRTRLLVTISIIVLVTTVIITELAVIVQQQVIRQDAYNQLATVADLKQAEITSWLANVHDTLSSIISNQAVKQDAITVISQGLPVSLSALVTPEQQRLQDNFNEAIKQTHVFVDIFLVNSHQDILFTLDASKENLAQINTDLENVTFTPAGKFTTPLRTYYTPSQQLRTSIVIGTAIINQNNITIGYIAGRLNVNHLQEVMAERISLGTKVETYLVDSQQNMITPSMLYSDWKYYSKLNSPGVITSQNKKNGSGAYPNYRGTPVFGVYHWLPDLGIALMAEQSQDEALSGMQSTILANIGSALLALLFAIIVSTIFAGSIARPINDLAKAATRVAAGDLQVKMSGSRQDEIGVLSKTFNTMTDQLQSMVQNLEERVTERTSELQKRSTQVRVAGEIARDIAGIDNLDQILNRAVDVIRDRFGFYHAGIFLADDQHEFAVLRASTGEAGRIMLERGHKLRIGETGIVGYVVAQGQPRVALNVVEDATYFRNPLLPDTRSEMALPLNTGGKVIGALDVQSKLASAFTQEDIDVLQTMADQLAIAIAKAGLLEQLQSNLNELERSYRQRTAQAWHEFLLKSRQKFGYRFRHFTLEQYSDISPTTVEAMAQNRPLVTTNDQSKGNGQNYHSTLTVPVKIRGQKIGVINLEYDSTNIDPHEVTLIENVANRLALALENARLLEQIQIRANQEHQVSTITAKIRSTSDIDTILKTVVQELSQALGVSGTVVKLTTETNKTEVA